MSPAKAPSYLDKTSYTGLLTPECSKVGRSERSPHRHHIDLQKEHKIFATVETNAAKVPALFAQKVLDEPTRLTIPTLPIRKSGTAWMTSRPDLPKLGDDAKAADAKVTDLDSFKAAFGNMGKNDCGSCHETYRVKKD
jgi:hypothetical protein